METERDVAERLPHLYSVLALPVDYDLICCTPSEWEQLQDQPFWRHARKTEMILYERG